MRVSQICLLGVFFVGCLGRQHIVGAATEDLVRAVDLQVTAVAQPAQGELPRASDADSPKLSAAPTSSSRAARKVVMEEIPSSTTKRLRQPAAELPETRTSGELSTSIRKRSRPGPMFTFDGYELDNHGHITRTIRCVGVLPSLSIVVPAVTAADPVAIATQAPNGAFTSSYGTGSCKIVLDKNQFNHLQPFIKAKLGEWERLGRPGDDWSYWFFETYFPNLPFNSRRCGPSKDCRPYSLDNLKQGLPCDEAKKAWHTGEYIAILNGDLNARHEGMQDAISNGILRKENWLHKYTEWDALQKEVIDARRKRDQILSGLFLGLSIVSALTSFAAPFAGAGATVGTLGMPKMLGSKFRQNIKSPSDVTSFSGTALNLLSEGPLATKTGFSLADAGHTLQDEWVAQADYREILIDIVDRLQNTTSHSHQMIMRGEKDANGHDIADLARRGLASLDAKENVQQNMKYMMDQVVGGLMLNAVWRSSLTYIVQAVTTNCQLDDRGDAESKICIEELPNNVFYLQSISRKKQHSVSPPIGHQLLSSLPGDITMEKIVRSSVAHYRKFGLSDPSPDQIARAIPGFFKDVRDSHIGGDMAGIFNIPIAVCNGGECISNHRKKFWNYPCIVGPEIHGWGSNDLVSEAEQSQFQRATGLFKMNAFYEWCSNPHKTNCRCGRGTCATEGRHDRTIMWKKCNRYSNGKDHFANT